MKLFLLSILVLTSLCFVLGDEDDIQPNFDDLIANDGQMVEDTPDDYPEVEEDSVSSISKFVLIESGSNLLSSEDLLVTLPWKTQILMCENYCSWLLPKQMSEFSRPNKIYRHTKIIGIFTYRVTSLFSLMLIISQNCVENVCHYE